MNSTVKKPFILILIAYFSVFSANSFASTGMTRLSAATSWSQARGMCRELGPTWDLPTVSDITSKSVSFEDFARIYVKDLKTQQINHFNLIWVRSDEEKLNQQLVTISQALKYEPRDGNFDTYVLNAQSLSQRQNYLNLLRENRNSIARTVSEQAELVKYLNSYESTEFGRQYPIDDDYPLEMQPGYIMMLPSDLMPLEIQLILSKPSQRWIDTEIENMQSELTATSQGLDVVCLELEF